MSTPPSVPPSGSPPATTARHRADPWGAEARSNDAFGVDPWSTDRSATIPAQRSASPPLPSAPAEPVTKPRRWPWGVGGLVLGIVIGASVAGGTRPAAPPAAPAPAPTAAASTSAPAPVAPPSAAPSSAAPAPVVAPPPGPATTFSDGVYEVGTDIAAGKYKTPGSGGTDILDSCYYEIGDGSGSITGIDKNDNLVGPGLVTLKKGKVFTTRGGCTWSKVG